MTSEKNCNYCCTCVREECSYKHRIDNLTGRKKFKEIFETNFNKDAHRETDPDGCRMKNCFHGYLCNNEDCGFKHFCNIEGRKLLSREWYKYHNQANMEIMLSDIDNLVEKYKITETDLIERIKKQLNFRK